MGHHAMGENLPLSYRLARPLEQYLGFQLSIDVHFGGCPPGVTGSDRPGGRCGGRRDVLEFALPADGAGHRGGGRVRVLLVEDDDRVAGALIPALTRRGLAIARLMDSMATSYCPL